MPSRNIRLLMLKTQLLLLSMVALLLQACVSTAPRNGAAPMTTAEAAKVARGEEVHARGLLAQATASEQGVLFLNFDDLYPHQTLTAVVPGGAVKVKKFKRLEGTTMEIRGTMVEYGGARVVRLADQGGVVGR